MAYKPINYLLGNGERLTEPVTMPTGGGEKEPPYTLDVARDRLVPMLLSAADRVDALPAAACPDGQAVLGMVLHPEYLAKSYFPSGLLREVGLRQIGSRMRSVLPDQRSLDRKPEQAPTTEIFVAVYREDFRQWATEMPTWTTNVRSFDQLSRLETISALDSTDKIKSGLEGSKEILYEVVLHAHEGASDDYVVSGFLEYLNSLQIEIDLSRRFYSGGLCFLRLATSPKQIRSVADYSFLRVAREMPKLRMMPTRNLKSKRTRPVELPAAEPLDTDIRVAVFDGGLREGSALEPWTDLYDFDDLGENVDECLDHGETVTSSLLFGSLPEDGPAMQPYSGIDHYQVLDKAALDNPYELYEVLERIKSILDGGPYPFMNFSIGPALPVEDEEVHAWTAVLDDYLADGKTLATIAVGNTGEDPTDVVSDAQRIQVPSDCVNGLSIGASNRRDDDWQRATYSSVGPGRSPGVIKPDLVAFGGSEHQSFWATDPESPGAAMALQGTSYAAPAALRTALGLRAHFGQSFQPLTLKALLIHGALPSAHPREEVGWGCVPEELATLVACPDGIARILYQGVLTPSQYLRARIPLPEEPLTGMVKITATFCYTTPVDPEHPGSYTRSGLEVIFRPHQDKYHNEDAVHPQSDQFFRAGDFQTEAERRRDAHQWETCLHGSKRKRANSLSEPVFDIHYNARAEGRNNQSAERIPYALVISIDAPRHEDLYERVRQRYRTILRPIRPVIQIPIQT